MSELYIYHHLGLGDHIICNAIVRNCSKQNDKIFLFVKSHNHESVKFMYRDLNNINYIVGDDSLAENYIKDNNIINLLKIGFEKLNMNTQHFDQSFYNQICMDFNRRWDDFYVKRDDERERKLFSYFNLTENEYIFVHDDPGRNKVADVKSDYKIIKPISGLTNIIFDYLYLIRNAVEIHCVDSSFKNLIDSISDIKNDKLYTYKSHHQSENHYPITKKNWIRK